MCWGFCDVDPILSLLKSGAGNLVCCFLHIDSFLLPVRHVIVTLVLLF